MTLKKSSGNGFQFTIKHGIKSITSLVALIQCAIISFCTVLFAVAELFGSAPVYDENGAVTEYVTNRDKYHFLILRDAEYMLSPLLICIAVCGILAAICTFNFITSKKMVNVYYSLGITRTKLFCGKYISGIILMLIATLIPMTILFFANVFSVGFSFTLLSVILYWTLNLFLIAATSFTVTAAIFAAVGTTFETAVFSVIILLLPDIFLYSIQALMDTFLYGTPYGQNFLFLNTYNYGYYETVATLPDQMNFLSPLFHDKNGLEALVLLEKDVANPAVPTVNPDLIVSGLWFIATILIFVLAVFIFNKRKAEICGFIGTNRILNTSVSSLAAFSAFCFVINITGKDLVISLVAGSLCFAAVHLILEAAVLRDLRKFTKGLYKLPVGIAVSVVIALIFNGGLFGFAQKIPAQSNIESVSVTAVGTTAEYGLFADSWTYGNYDVSFFASSGCLAGEFTSENDIKAVLDVHKAITEDSEESRTTENTIQFIYKLKNGTTLKRSFNRISPEAYKKLLYLEDSDFYNNTLTELFKGEIKKYNVYEQSARTVFADAQRNLRNNYYVKFYSRFADKEFSLTLSENDRLKLLDALYKDLSDRTVDEKYYPSQSPVGFLIFSYGSDELDAQTAPERTEITEKVFSARFESFLESGVWAPYFNTCITTDMTNTVELLKELGLYEKLITAPEFITAEVIPAETAYEYYIGNETYLLQRLSRCFVTRYSSAKSTIDSEGDWEQYSSTLGSVANEEIYTDKAKIADLLAKSYTVYEQDDIKQGSFVSFRTADGDTSICFIPAGK